MDISPYFIGSGRSAQAIKESLAIVGILEPSLKIASPIQIQRGQPLPDRYQREGKSIAIIANPHGLHAASILEADANGFDLIISEKPACVSLEQIRSLRRVSSRTLVCHVYRQTWGIQKLKEIIVSGDVGEVFAIEGRYWQSAAAQRASGERSGGGWKNDVRLNGPFDALLDTGVHWADTAVFLAGSLPKKTSIWLGYANAEAAHRDSHVQLSMHFERQRGMASISKTIHGAANHFEVNVLGSRQSLTWNFMSPDQIQIGQGSKTHILQRTDNALGSGHPPFHGLGWIEGYVELLRSVLTDSTDRPSARPPELKEHLDLVELLLNADISRS